MAETIELEEIERLIEQLPPAQRLKLIARICEQLSTITAIDQMESEAEKTKNERLQLAKQLLSEVEDVEDDSQGEFDVDHFSRQQYDISDDSKTRKLA